MRRLLIFFIFFWCIACIDPFPAQAAAGPTDKILEDSGVLGLQQFITAVDEDLQSYLGSLDVMTILRSIAAGDLPLTPMTAITMVSKILFKELALNMQLLGKLIILAIIAATLQQMIGAFSDATVGKMAHMVVFLALMTLAIASFTYCIDSAKTTVEEIMNFLKALFPILVTLTAAEGGFLTAGLLHPLLIFFLGFVGTILQTVIFPAIYLYAVLLLVNRISPMFKVERLAGLMKDGIFLVMGFTLTVFVGFLSLQGITGAVADGLGMKTAKFATKTFLPVVGGFMADAVETVAGTAVVMKNAVGVFGVIMLVLICIYPAIKVLLTAFVFKFAAAVVEPFGDGMISGALEDMGKSIMLTFGVLVAAGVIFFFAITVIVGVGNVNIMMR